MAAARAGTGSLIVIEGPPGIGKSRLLDAAREDARAEGMQVLSTAGLELERDYAFGLATRLLEPALEPARREGLLAEVPTMHTLFGTVTAVDSAAGTDHGYALVHGLRRITSRLADAKRTGGGPLLICVDDVQWADEPTLRFLAHLAASAENVSVAIVAATRSDRQGPPIELRHALESTAHARVLRPRALSESAVKWLVEDVFPAADPAFARACAHATQGNPFYLSELLKSALSEGMAPTARSAEQVRSLLPESVARSVLLRLARLDEPAPALAAAAAVLGDGAELRHAALLARMDMTDAERAADTLAAAHVLQPGDPLAFTHSLIAAAVRSDMPAHARSRAHRRAAELLHDDGLPAEAVAAHLLACRGESDPAAARTLRAAAARAAGQGDHGSAQRLLVRALAEPPPPELRASLELELALAEAAVGAPTAVARVSAALDTVEEAPKRIEVLRALARLLFARSEFDAAADAIEQAISAVHHDDPVALALRVDAVATASLASRPAWARVQQLLEQADAGQLPDAPGLLAQLAAIWHATGRPALEVAQVARAALAGLPADDGFYGVITGHAVLALIGVDELEAAETSIRRALARATESGSLIAAGTASHWQAELRYHQGKLTDAISAAQETLEICEAGWDMCQSWVAPVLAHAQMDTGDLDAAEPTVMLAESSARGSRQQAIALASRGRLTLLRGDAPRALDELLAAGDHADRAAIPPTTLPWRSWASLTANRLARHELADTLAQSELAQARAIGAPRTLGTALRAAGTARGGGEGLALLSEAAEVLERSPSELERARGLVALGAALRREGQPTASRDPLRRGLELAQELGAAPLADRARAELSAAGGRRRRRGHKTGVDALTPMERQIANLAASGLSTPQIAHSLHVTGKTVDWHLGHVYRKLGINSRRHLAAVLEPQPASTPQ